MAELAIKEDVFYILEAGDTKSLFDSEDSAIAALKGIIASKPELDAEWKHKYCVIPWEAKQDMDMIRMGQLMQAVVRKANHAINLREELPSGAPLPEIAGDMSRTRKKLLYGSAEASEEEENKDSENESGEENADQN